MVAVFERLASGSVSVDFRSAAWSATWTGRPEGRWHIDDLVEFEARVNDVWCRHDDAVICGSCHAWSAHSLIGGHYHAP